MNQVQYNQEDNDNKRRNRILLVFLLVIALIFSIGMFIFLVLPMVNTGGNTDDDTTQVSKEYDKLLEIINKKINETKLVSEESVTSITSFIYEDNHFYISAVNTYVYDLSLDLTSNNFVTEVEAYQHIINSDISSLSMTYLDRYDVSSNNDFVTKYIKEENSYKYGIGSIGPVTKTFMTSLSKTTNDISIIYGVDLSDTLSDGYSPKVISKENQLYKIYKYIATK